MKLRGKLISYINSLWTCNYRFVHTTEFCFC